MTGASKYSPELQERAVRMVSEHAPQYASQWAAVESIAAKIGCTAETLRRWVRQGERDAGVRPGLTTAEGERIKTLERENRELRGEQPYQGEGLALVRLRIVSCRSASSLMSTSNSAGVGDGLGLPAAGSCASVTSHARWNSAVIRSCSPWVNPIVL